MIRNISELHLLLHSDSPSGTATISCGRTAKLFIENTHLVRFSHLYFIGCNENKIKTIHQLIINTSTFRGLRNANGTALELVHTDAEIINSSFIFNGYGSYRGPIGLLQFLKIQGRIFQQSVYAQIGGALIINCSNVSIIGSNFEGNSAEIGGAIFGEGSSNITLTNCIFINNHAFSSSCLCFGGAIFSENSPDNPITSTASILLVNTKFINNTSANSGGAIGAFYIQVEILKCSLTMNSALSGGVMTVHKFNIPIYDSYLNLSVAHHDDRDGGGAIYAISESVISITETHFYNNTALNGVAGVLLAISLSTITITESVFHNNSAETIGGVVTTSLACNLIILQCQFRNNKASQGGIVAAEFQSNVTIFDSSFESNTAYIRGGVVYLYDGGSLIIAKASFKDNIADVGSVLTQNLNTLALVDNSNFYNNLATNAGGLFAVTQSGIQLQNCEFNNNRALYTGGVVAARQQSVVFIIDSSAFNNTSEVGGVVSIINYCTIQVERSQFSGCKALKAGGIFVVEHFSKLAIQDCKFRNNMADLGGGGVALVLNNSYAIINGTQFSFNKAYKGGAIHSEQLAHVAVSDCDFSKNSATYDGGVINLNFGSELRLTRTTLNNNNATVGGAIDMDTNVTAVIEESTFIGNTASMGSTIFLSLSRPVFITNTYISESFASIYGTVLITRSRVYFKENVAITNNFGSVHVIDSHLYLLGNTNFENNLIINKYTNELEINEGGAITLFRGTVVIEGTSNFNNNTAENGAAINAINSIIDVKEPVTITNNTARYNGGGIYLYQSQIQCTDNCSLTLVSNHALHSGGGIYAVSSTTEVAYHRGFDDQQPLLLFFENTAQAGGGLYVEANAKLYTLKAGYQTNETAYMSSCCSIVFSNNYADYGGAIFVDDGTSVGVCDSNPRQASSLTQKHPNYTECFLQVLDADPIYSLDYTSTSINFSHNYADYAGSTLFGGLLDRCIASPFAEIYLNYVNTPIDKIYDGVSYFKGISNIVPDTVSSYPVKVCFCNDGQPDCSFKLPIKKVKKGQSFTVTLVAIDQVNHTISNTTIHSYLTFVESGFGEGQLIQKTQDSCTDLTYSITTTHDSERLIIYAEGPCRDSSISKKWIDLQFIPCSCPIGFQQKDTENTNCVCICDTALLPYVSECNVQEETVTKHNDAWISYVNNTLNSSGYLIHNHCPFDYCLSPSSDHEIKVNLNKKNGADAQCAYNRIGTLCGTCKSGFTLSLGSSHCISCSHWHTNLSAILLAAIVSGIVLVALLLVLNLTVAVGTLNGVIFYTNIVASNFSMFFPFSSPNFITVFISWLNLDIGIDACFFEGMDAYWKLWVNILFPTYLMGLVVLVIFISEKSTKFALLLGRKNPVATLATLILLSYTKLLRTVILSFSFATLKYPDNSTQLVWLPDGTVKYLSGKHIALFIAALIIVIAGVAYTFLLFFWQWLLIYQDKFVFKWANDLRLNHFLDPYHAPYIYEHRYWTGLLLLVRAVLYIIAAVNVSNDPGTNLLALGCTLFGILVLKGYLKKNKIYKKWSVELLEIICYVNLAFICLMSFYLLEAKASQRVVAYISGSITLALFIIIMFYHIVFEFIMKSELWMRFRNQPPRPVTQNEHEDNNFDTENDQAPLIAPTCTTVEVPPLGEEPLSGLV